MRIELLWPGKTKDRRYKELIDDYTLRIKRFSPCEIIELKTPSGIEREERAIIEESAKILSKVNNGDFIVLLDECGKQFSSTELADYISKHQLDGTKRLVFVVGGFAGIGDDVKHRANIQISLSRMTLPHELARVILAEQIYRALSLIAGTSYHKF